MNTYSNLLGQYLKCLSLKHRYIHLDNDASYLTIRDDKKLYIYFQWSKGLKDWIHNFRFLARPIRPYKEMKRGGWFCHGGFLKVWKSIEPLIADEIKNVEVEEIEIVGYSHGAALAQLCYEYVKYHRQDVKLTGVGFGSPRVVWGIVSKEAKTRFKGFKVVRNKHDIVTHVPPVIFGFRHLTDVIKIGSYSEGLFDDHRPELYIEALEEAHYRYKLTHLFDTPCARCEQSLGDGWQYRNGAFLCADCAKEYDDHLKDFYGVRKIL